MRMLWALALAAGLLAPAQPDSARSEAERLDREATPLYARGEYKASIPLLRKAAALDPANSGVRLRLGVALFQTGSYGEAETELSALRTDPAVADRALYFLFETYRKIAQGDKAVSTFADLLRRYPNSPFTRKLMGTAYESQQRYDEAIAEFEAALKADPEFPDANFAIGYIEWKRSAFDRAAPRFEAELKIQPCSVQSLYYLGEIAREGRDPKTALARAQAALKCDPKSVEALLLAAGVYEEQDAPAKALADYAEAVRLAPENVAARLKYARVLRSAGRTADADRETRAAEAIAAQKKKGPERK